MEGQPRTSICPDGTYLWRESILKVGTYTPLPAQDSTLERHKYQMARLARKTFDMLVVSPEPFNYGMIHELDREYREMLDAMPDAFQHEYATLEAQDPYIRSRRYIAMQGVHVRMHESLHWASRPELLGVTRPPVPHAESHRSPASPFPRQRLGTEFSLCIQVGLNLALVFPQTCATDDAVSPKSSEACVRSAKVVVLSHHNNLKLDFGLSRNLRMLYSVCARALPDSSRVCASAHYRALLSLQHSLTAATVLAADLFQSVQNQISVRLISS